MRWNLSVLYPSFDDDRFKQDFDALEALLNASFEWAQGLNITSAADLERCMTTKNDILDALSPLSGFIRLTMSADAGNEAALAQSARLENADMLAERVFSAIARAIGGIGGMDKLSALIAQSPALAPYSFALREIFEGFVHLIPKALEPAVLELRLSGAQAFERLFEMTFAKHAVPIVVDGAQQHLPLAQVRSMADSSDAALRKSAYEAELAAYPAMETSIAACLNANKRDAVTMAGIRGYASPLDMTLKETRMDAQTLDAMMAAMREALPAFRRYYRAKARYLGYEGGLKFYDLFAPVGEPMEGLSVDACRDMLARYLSPFTPGMAEMIERAFGESWIDLFPRAGKAGGAFCANLSTLGQSRILANSSGSFGDVRTLAHELGHAYHNWQMRGMPQTLTDVPMVLAETASIFNEALLTDKALNSATPAQALGILESGIMDAGQVIVDILSRYLFETAVVEAAPSAFLSPKELCALMLDAQKQAYGDALDPDCLHPYMWACKPHYYMSGLHFYNFPYAFGLLFARGVYALYERGGASFTDTYDKLLRFSGTNDVRGVAASVGIDVADIAFWRTSLGSIEADIDRFIALCEG